MDDRDKVQDLLDKFTNEADKTIRLIETLRIRATDLAQKVERILNPETKKKLVKQSITELEELIEKLVTVNIDLELDYVDAPNLTVPYFTPGDDVHTLNFLSGDNPWNFWLIDSNVDSKNILKNLLQKHQDGLLDPMKTPKAAQSVCFIDKNKVMRGIIVQIKNENRIKIVDCDSNVTKVVSSDKLFVMDEEACQVHASALRCCISEDPDAIELWNNSDLRDLFCNILREATLNVKIVKRMAGSFPIFVVDVELQNEDEECTANLKEWVMNRLLPELKKLDSDENDNICDFLSEESLSPYYKIGEKEMNNEVPKSTDQEDNKNPQLNKAEIVIEEKLNNLNYPTDKLSEKVVADLSHPSVGNKSQETMNNLENPISTSSEDVAILSSSTDDLISSSSRESHQSDLSHKIDSRLNYHSQEFRPKFKKPDIPRLNKKYQSKNTTPPPYYPPIGANCTIGPVAPQVPSHIQMWSYTGQNLHQGNSSWPYQPPQSMPVQQPMQHQQHTESTPQTWAPSLDSAFKAPEVPNSDTSEVPFSNIKINEVNVMAPEFVPKSGFPQKNPNKVEIPPEHVILRKSATLIKENENLLVMISHVESPSEFYVHFVNQNNKYLDKLYEDMFTYYSSREKVEFESWRDARNKLGKFCACKWAEDNHWYRVEVLEWAAGDDQVMVCFVDHGNTERVPLASLQPLSRPFDKLSICSQSCCLAKVHPAIKGQPWSDEAIQFFKSKVEVSNSRLYSVTVVESAARSVKPNSFSVLLFESKATEGSKSINELMVEEGLAWSRNWSSEPVSSTNSEVFFSLDDQSDGSDQILLSLPTESQDPQDPLLLPVLEAEKPIRLLEPSECHIRPPVLLSTSSDLQNDPVDAFALWDPRKEDYESARNNPALDTDDACVAVSGYSARDEARICKFYARDGYCFKAVCYKEHSMPNPDGVTTDKEEVYIEAFSQLELPKPGEVVKLKITHVFSINLFYAQLQEAKAVAVDDELKEEAETLTSLELFMNESKNKLEMKKLLISPSPGELVLAREVNEDGSEWWYRARVITSSYDSEDDKPEIMYVDYGSTCTVSETDLRKMEKRYLHLPFQAIECSLANVIPLENEEKFIERGTELLHDVLFGQKLTARVYESEDVTDDVVRLQVLLELDDGTDVGDFLVENKICQHVPMRKNILQFP